MKALVVDDSVLYRRAIVAALKSIPKITEIIEASNGKEAVRKQQEVKADLITLDIEMPLMSGIEAIPELLKANSKSYILMVSSLTLKGASKTIEALNAGASDFITKEHAFGLAANQKNILMEEIKARVESMSVASKQTLRKQNTKAISSSSVNQPEKGMHKKTISPTKVELVLVGSSTGGPKALQDLFKPMKTKRNYAIVIVQHMPPIFTAQLAENLTKQCGHQVKEAKEGMVLSRNDIVIAPGGHHLVLEKKNAKWICHLNEDPPVNSCRPSVDVTFESVSEQLRSREAIAMVLTGMGDDGARGCKKLFDKKVLIMTQDKESCTVYGMPRAVDKLEISSVHKAPIFLMEEAEKNMVNPRDLSLG
jgi:two-component system chemotaxis response regulator CheB